MKSRKQKQAENPSGGRRRQRPATIRQRTEPDPVDVALGDTDTDGRTDTTSPSATTTATAATPTTDVGGSDSDNRHDGSPGDDRQRQPTPAGPTPAAATATTDTTARPATPTTDTDTSAPTPTRVAAPPTAPPPTRSDAATAEAGEPMKSVSYSLPPSLIERVRAAQWHTQLKPDGHHNVSELVRRVLLAEVERLEREHNAGTPFPRVERLPTGPSPRGAVRGAQIRAARRGRSDAGEAQEQPAGEAASTRRGVTQNPASEGGAVR
ncbi:hypothetical protein [Streptomyces sp. NPDC048623]|uniref:ParB family protein n=1 Tax=Streptomyces sp. NPDC048623 TaxID=3155761 RepID=UPI0034214652